MILRAWLRLHDSGGIISASRHRERVSFQADMLVSLEARLERV